jgi:hypothetical protein
MGQHPSTARDRSCKNTGGTGKFYPDWEDGSGTCLEDGNEPLYMAMGESLWLSDSLVECCLQFYQWVANSCLTFNAGGSGLWYVDPSINKCVTDCAKENGETCGGLADVSSDRLYSDPKSCCESELQWMFVDYCEASLPRAVLQTISLALNVMVN